MGIQLEDLVRHVNPCVRSERGNHIIFYVDKIEGGRYHSRVKFKGGNVGLILTQSKSKLSEMGYC